MKTMQQFTLTRSEKRRFPRIATSAVVDYALFDAHRKKIDRGKGRALNLSQKGALLETQNQLHGEFIILLAHDLEGEKIMVKGQVANTRRSDITGLYLTGVEFIGSHDAQRKAVVALVKVYNHQKYYQQQS